jgi:TetR/AcrR family transcriptional regulator, ethionamide resistance regulator
VATTPLKRRTRALSKGDRRETELLKGAERLLDEGAFDDASVAELAAAAGVSRPTFYFYFASKDALLASVVQAVHHDIAACLLTALDQPGEPSEQIAGAIHAAADAWWEHRAAMSAAMQLAQRIPELGARMRESMTDVNRRCTEILLAHGAVPERQSPTRAARLIGTLALMNERVFSHEVPRARTRRELTRTEQSLLAVWTRALGLPQSGEPRPDTMPQC